MERETLMKGIAFLLVAISAAGSVLVSKAPASGRADGEAAPIFGIKIYAGIVTGS